MREKKYGSCYISYTDESLEVLIEYKKTKTISRTGDVALIFTGKDLITGTPLNSVPVSDLEHNLCDAAWNGSIKKGRLIACKFYEMSKAEMIGCLKTMKNAEIEAYVKKIDEIKLKYSKALEDANNKKKEAIMLKKMEEKSIEAEKGRIKNIIKHIIKK